MMKYVYEMSGTADGNLSSLTYGADQRNPLSDASSKSWPTHKRMKKHMTSSEQWAELLPEDMLQDVV